MATQPRLTERQVAQQPLSGQRLGVRATPEGMGAGLASGAQQATGAMLEVYERERGKADELAVMEADQRLAQWEAETVFDEKTGLLRRRGRDALGVPDDAMKSLSKLRSEIERGLVGDRQLVAFTKKANARQQEIQRRLQNHVAGEMAAYQTAETQAFVETSVRNAGNKWDDPEAIANELNRQEEAIVALAEAVGMSPEVRGQQLTKYREQTHLTVIGRMVDSRDLKTAREYFNANIDDLGPEGRSKVQSILDTADLRARGQEAEDRIMAAHPGDMAGALKAARDLPSEIRDDAVARIKVRFSELDTIKQVADRERIDTVTKLLQSNGGDYDAIPGTILSELTPKQQGEAKALAEYIRTGMPTHSWAAWSEITAMAAMEPEKFAGVNLMMEYRAVLGDQQFSSILAEQNRIRQEQLNLKQGGGPQSETLSFTQIFEGVARELEVIPRNKSITGLSKKDAADFYERRRRAVDEIADIERTSGKKLSTQEKQAIATRVLGEYVMTPGRIWGTNQRRPTMLTPDQIVGGAFVPRESIPSSWWTQSINEILSTEFGGIPLEEMSVGRAKAIENALQRDYAIKMYSGLEGEELDRAIKELWDEVKRDVGSIR